MGVPGRLQHIKGHNGALVIDDSYNANPASMKAAIDVLATQVGEKILVLGDMGEMGAGADALHADIGSYAKAGGINTLLTLGTLSAHITQAFGSGARHFASAEDLSADLVAHMTANTAVLVKGSRFMKMERIVKAITVTHDKQNNGGH
jgi:UDP-N-acetylmuramoyl-tripeptide--D-alanyl-D-alanine ligase